MPWFRLDDSFDTHPKILMAGNEAIGLYIRCGTYAARNLTDGAVPRDIAVLYGAETPRTLSDGCTETLAGTLVRSGLWHRARTGWIIHDYLDYNPSREEVLSKRKIRAEAGRIGGVASGKARSKPEAKRSPSVEPPARPGLTNTGLTEPGTRADGWRPPSRRPDSRPVKEVLELPEGHRPASAEGKAAAIAAAKRALGKPP